MTLINTCMLMLVLQPLFVYLALFKQPEFHPMTDTPVKNDDALFLFVTPGVSVFYFSQFFEALLYLGGVWVLGLLLAVILASKAKKPVTKDDAISFTIAGFIFFGIIKLIAMAIAYFFMDDPANDESVFSVSQLFSVDYLYNALWPTLYFLVLMIITLVIKVIEHHSSFKKAPSGLLITLGAALAGVAPLFGEAYIVGIIANFIIFIVFCSLCLKIDVKKDPSAGAIGLFFGYILMMGIGFSVICKVIYELFFN
ncbi:hypothetical protein [Pseudoalteromonas sp. L21]|uniref:hypothetical protein n=1 Tax=Pseudoalteromonas sp. L21 TaxID=1539746 RepID=UPI001F486F2C|nr:hypothetical protein [Pseudoalteromonas sp. L21]